ncbi:rab9 effector protein with kelch motifs isoform X1 [Python bivittatus]|uniref:Rab9 effector protein with kelch motifs n=1 Tax=Python bivittatus TaxID=176946 RepID=A0A9F5MSC9_PYTBI|nr:rab9 effector protein with kelch motifs isoform X1 [Python bivittatus]
MRPVGHPRELSRDEAVHGGALKAEALQTRKSRAWGRSKGYSLALCGKSPCARVGQNSLYLPPLEPGSRNGKVVIIAGANPSGSFADSYFIDLDANCWTAPGWVGLLPRYEHAAFVPTSQPNTLWVYGGATETGNRDCVQVLDLETGSWEKTSVTGNPPSPRTFHTSSAAIGDRLYVFGGGEKGVDPVKDQQLHIFDSATFTWLQPDVRGQPPAPRHGHVVVAVENRLFVHGGLAGDTFYDDLFSIDIKDLRWEMLSTSGSIPGGRAAHSAVAFQGHIYIFGGMDSTGELNTMYKYHIEKANWTRLEFNAPLPLGRLDHSMCIIPWETSGKDTRNRKETQGPVRGEGPGQGGREERLVHLCLVFGGMNIKGEIYNDCIVSVLE